jgi:hypothetical protein
MNEIKRGGAIRPRAQSIEPNIGGSFGGGYAGNMSALRLDRAHMQEGRA